LITDTEWPEGYLSLFRDRLVANSRLSRAALETGLSKYILTVPFTGQKWRPLYVDDILEDTMRRDTDRKLSTKVLADVVESLIGASYIVGGTLKAVQCISIFIKDCQWRSIVDSRSILYDNALNDCALSPMLQPLEVLLGYSFKKKSLLIEACTHASFIADMGRRSMERLEFLGDAVLDNVIVTRLFSHGPPLPHHAMHMIKTAMVNKDFLAFIALEEHDLQETEAYVDANGSPCERSKTGALWRFMRHASMPIGLVQATVSDSHQALRNEILTAISEGTHYPWALLARLQAKKFYCDIFEALLGAVWIDSGSIDECKSIVSRFGITSYLERILRDNVHVQHPKEELGKLALSETVNYKMEIKADDAGEKEYSCQVLVGERLVAEVDGGLNKEEVKTKAATEAVRILTMEASRSQCAHLGDD
jgi:dsRNA-specific ribonuclease